MNIAIFGFGSVGRTLSNQARAVGVGVLAVADSSGVLISKDKTNGFSTDELNNIINAKEIEQKRLKDIAKVCNAEEAVHIMSEVNNRGDKGLVLADCSAYSDPSSYLFPALDNNIPIALANKKPLTGSFEDFSKLTRDRSLIRFESTVGAGLPVISTLRRILDSGDSVLRIEGQLSGTLGYILSGLQLGNSFSSIVGEAKTKGFTEPDPRDDLSGLDVARKALILARCLGKPFELSDIAVEALYPQSMADQSIDEFMNNLSELDSSFKEKVGKAEMTKQRLRYAATVTSEKLDVGLLQVEATSPLASLQGTDNLISFQTNWYKESPTVIRGPGAGLEVTAAGVLSDAMDIYGSKIRQKYGV